MEWYIAASGYLSSVYLNERGNAIVRRQAVYKIQSVVDYINDNFYRSDCKRINIFVRNSISDFQIVKET